MSNQAKMNRSLMIHNLDNLVYQKRERKTIVQTPINYTIQKNKIKKKQKNTNTNNPEIVRSSVGKITLPKKNNLEKKQIKPTVEPNKYQKKSTSRPKTIVRKKQQPDSISISNKQDSSIPINKASKISINEDCSKNNQDQSIKKRGRPKKQPQDQLSHPQLQPINQTKMPQIVPVQPLAIQQERINQVQQEQQQQQASGTKIRKAKLNPLKKYNEDDDQEDDYFESSFQNQKRKRKRINKQYKNKKSNKPYTLNRIFRKQKKKQFKQFVIDVDLQLLNLVNIVNKFGTFDLIHFSLPITYLQTIPQIPCLIQKGFIFLWAQHKETQIGYHLLNRWGFDVIDQIMWIKCNQDENQIYSTKQNLFLNCRSICLVGYKCPLGNKAQYRTKVSNNIIFSKPLTGISKPIEIYQIADLMMPGSKKIEIGGTPAKGWLTLRHNERTLTRCNHCLKQNQLNMTNIQSKPTLCNHCISQLSNLQQGDKNIFKRINELKQYNDRQELSCSTCNLKQSQLEYRGFIQLSPTTQQCLNCIKQYPQNLSIITQRRYFYESNTLNCSNCKVKSLKDIYFECNKCKNHIICRECFWVENQRRQNAKKQMMHEWRIKFIKNSPLLKSICFGCKNELSIPYWCCQTCQNWFWCGKCDKGSHEIHPHYQNDQHHLYLMI